MALFKNWEISNCEQNIANLKMRIAGTSDPSAKRFYRVELVKEQERLKLLKKS